MTRARELSKLANANILSVDSSNNIGIGSTTPDAKLDVAGEVLVGTSASISSAGEAVFVGVVTSSTGFSGIGTGVSIQGLTATSALEKLVLSAGAQGGIANTMATSGSLYWNNSTSTLYATNVNVSGTMTTEDVANTDAVGLVTAGLGFRATKGGLVVTAGIVTAPGLDISTGGVDIDGQTDLDEVVVAGVITASNNVNVSGGTITVGTGITVAAVAGFGTFSKGVKLGKGGLLVEGISSVSAGFDNTSDLNLDDGMVHYTNDALAGNANTLNLTSSVGINTAMALNEMIIVTGITSVSSTSHYVNALTIDNVKARNICWIGGAAPTEGGSTGFDVYTFNVWKTGDKMFNVIANHVTCTA